MCCWLYKATQEVGIRTHNPEQSYLKAFPLKTDCRMALVELLGEQIKGKDGKDVDVASFQGEGKVGVMASVQYHAS